MISKHIIDKVLDAANIVDVVSDFVSLKKSKTSYKCCCPFHSEKTASFVVSPSKNLWHCFGQCQEGGDAVNFVMKHESMSYPDAIRYLAKKYNIEIEEETDASVIESQKRQEALFIVNNAAQDYFANQIKHNSDAYAYAIGRWGEEFVKEQGIGYAPNSWDSLLAFLTSNGYSVDAASSVGLIKSRDDGRGYYDFYRDRITIPIRDRYHRVTAFTCRSLPREKSPGQKESPKYLNSKSSEIYDKSESIFGIDKALRQGAKEEKFYLMEGAPDAMRLQSIGVFNAIASLGGVWTEKHFSQIRRYASALCFIPDQDVQKDEGELPPGTKFVLANGALALKEGFDVFVRPIPKTAEGEKQDPDSFITSIEIFDSLKEVDFIIWAAHIYLDLAGKQTSRRSKAVHSIAELVAYTDIVKREMYIDQLTKIDGKRSLWKRAIQEVADQNTEKKTKNLDRSLYERYGFWIENNKYYSYQKGDPVQWSNFLLTPLYHIRDTINPKRLFIIQNDKGVEEIVEIKTEDMISLNGFRRRVEALGNYVWLAKEEQLQKLKMYLFENVQSAIEVEQLGWHRKGFFAFGNGVYYAGRWIDADKYGIVRIGENGNYYLPSKSMIYENEDMLYQWERKFVFTGENSVSMYQYCQSLVDVFGDNAKVGICFLLATLFRDIVFSCAKHFPLLNLFGPKGSGKSQLGHALMAFFITNNEPPNIENTTIAALAAAIAQCSNALVHIDEFKNSIDIKKREFFKGLWDGTGRTKMDMDRGKQKQTSRVSSGIIVSGQEMATSDIALFSRMIFLTFGKSEFTQEEQRKFEAMKTLRSQGLSHLTLSIMRHREKFQAGFKEAYDETKADINERLEKMQVETRTVQNWLVPLAAMRTLGSSVILPFSYDEMLDITVEGIVRQNTYVTQNNEVSCFWEGIRALRASSTIYKDSDYRIIFAKELKGLRNGVTYNFVNHRAILLLNESSIFPAFSKFAMQTRKEVMPEGSIKYYLEQSHGFLGIKNSCRFKQMQNGYDVTKMDGQKSIKLSSVDVAYCFDYDIVKDRYNLNLDNLSGFDEDPEQPPKPPEVGLQIHIPFEE